LLSAHRDLHTFPTRRSSDLGIAMASIGTAAAGATRRSTHPITNDDLAQLRGEHEPPCVSIYLPLQRAYPDRHQGPVRYRNLVEEDRKSTRLNSSHQIISYAV